MTLKRGKKFSTLPCAVGSGRRMPVSNASLIFGGIEFCTFINYMSTVKLLVVEDEIKTANSLKRGLEENGYQVEVAYDGLSAMQYAKSGGFHVILMDLIIPGLGGLELCKRLREEKIETPIIMLTA